MRVRNILKSIEGNRGITLVEVLTSIAIIGVLLITLLTIFSGNLQNVTRAGTKTKYVFSAQEQMNDIIKEIEEGRISATGDFLNINFKDRSGKSWSVQVNGKKVSTEAGEDTNKVKLTTFIAK